MNWWELSLNAKQRAYHQLFDEVLRYPFKQFCLDLEELLGHPVMTHEFATREHQMKLEAIKAYEALGYHI